MYASHNGDIGIVNSFINAKASLDIQDEASLTKEGRVVATPSWLFPIALKRLFV